jgi:copper chaperone NosL
MERRHAALTLLALAAGARIAGAQPVPSIAGEIPPPGPRDHCPICGMLVAKYPGWVAAVRFRSGALHYFDGAKDMFKFVLDLPHRAPGRGADAIAAVVVTEFYDLARIDARSAWYVIGSDVLGPMGHELVPLKSGGDAEEFARDHKGRRTVRFDQVTLHLVEELDRGHFATS